MPLVRCNGCDRRPADKLTQTTWSWRRADGVRKAYRSRLCPDCFMVKVSPLALSYEGVERLTCPACGIETEDDMDAIYTTNYIPGYGELRTESPFCNACAAIQRGWVLDHSWELEDQLGATGGPQHNVTGDEVLASLGIQLRKQ